SCASRMLRLCATALVVACLGPGTALAAGTRIYTVAGGGTTAPASFGDAATGVALNHPTSVRSAGDGTFFLADASCRPLFVHQDAGKDTGTIGYGPGQQVAGAAPCDGSATA